MPLAVSSDLLGTIPQWLTGGAVVTFVGLLLKRDVQVRGLKNADSADIRDHYADEVGQLSEQFRNALTDLEKRYRDALEESEQRHQKCLDDRDLLRERVNQLEDELRGLIRVITQASIDRVLMLGDDVPQDIREASERVEAIIKERGRQR
jgi:hypothetical protein